MSAMDEKNILNLISKSTEPESVPDFSEIAAKTVSYKRNNSGEKPPRKYNLKKRLAALGIAAALILGIAGGVKLTEYVRTEFSPYGNVLRAFEKYNRASFSVSGFFGLFGFLMPQSKNMKNDAAGETQFKRSESGSLDYAVTEDSDSTENYEINEESPGGESEKSDHSETNVQVEGVDESDIVKTDGKYFYIQSKSGSLRIVNAAEMKLVSEITRDTDFTPAELYLSGSRLVQIGLDNAESGSDPAGSGYNYESYHSSKSGNTRTKIIVYNIKDPAKPRVEGKYTQDGALLSSRVIDGAIYLVSSSDVYNTENANISNIEEYIPKISSNGVSECVPADSIEILKSSPTAYTIISGMKLNNLKDASIQTILGSGNDIYASLSRVYVYGSRYDSTAATAIMSFDISEGKVKKAASGEVPGELLNQFCLDEYEGYLRVGTSGNGNSVFVLDKNLKIAGKIENLAPGENLKSVRFAGKTGYVVTFMQTDPLFAIDLTDPKKPRLLGELKIPGFSTYMHPYDKNTIIGIGFDADPFSGFATALKLSLFDVSDPANMKETKTITFGKDSFGSEATTDHRAVLFSREKNLLVIPAEYRGYSGDNGDYTEFCGAIVLNVTNNNIQQTAFITHVSTGEKDTEDRKIRRAAYIGDKLYTFSERTVMCVSLTDFSFIGKLEFAEKSSNGDVPIITPDAAE